MGNIYSEWTLRIEVLHRYYKHITNIAINISFFMGHHMTIVIVYGSKFWLEAIPNSLWRILWTKIDIHIRLLHCHIDNRLSPLHKPCMFFHCHIDKGLSPWYKPLRTFHCHIDKGLTPLYKPPTMFGGGGWEAWRGQRWVRLVSTTINIICKNVMLVPSKLTTWRTPLIFAHPKIG